LSRALRVCIPVVLLLFTSCRFDEKTIGPGVEQVVVHAVLDPGRFEHRILLEHVLTGRIAISDRVPFDSLDPIVSQSGAPVSGATVTIFGPRGDSAVAVERLAPSDGHGTGMYTFFNRADAPSDGPASPALLVLAGETYRLRVTTTDGHLLTATTTIPRAGSPFRDPSTKAFNRDHQDFFLFWSAIPGAARYEIAVTSPNGAFSTFVDSLEFVVSGTLRNTKTRTFTDVFVPGFVQDVTVSAVDDNYFDYYRSASDVFSGRGLINRIDGGLGVFGSAVMLRFVRFNVTADMGGRLEGVFDRIAGSGPVWMRLYVTSDYGSRVALSGNYSASSILLPGALGTINGDSISIALLRGQSAHDTAMTIDGKFDGTTLRGRIRGSGTLVEYQRFIGP
jgi:hypothetical protein